VKRLEPILLALFLVCWAIDLAVLLGLIKLANNLPLTLYGLYSVAVALGWLFGNIYVRRARGLSTPLRRRLLVFYFLGPPSLLYLLWYMTPLEFQKEAPLVPLYAFCVFSILFLVPVTLIKPPARR
jgi:hypothetical protein